MSSLISICLFILSRKHEKQARVDFLQRNLSVNGMIIVYMLFNNSTNECKYFIFYYFFKHRNQEDKWKSDLLFDI